MKNVIITGQGRDNTGKVLPDSNTVMDCKVPLMSRAGIKDVHFHFCLGSERTPWTRARRWLCFLMLCLIIGTLMLIFYDSSIATSWVSQFHNMTASSVSVSMFSERGSYPNDHELKTIHIMHLYYFAAVTIKMC